MFVFVVNWKNDSCRFRIRRCYCWRLRRLRAWAGPSRHWENGSHRRAPSTFSSQPPPPPSTRPNPFPSVVFRCLFNVLWYSNPSQPVYMYCLPLHCGLNHCLSILDIFWYIQTYLVLEIFWYSNLPLPFFWLSGGLFVFCCLFFATATLVLFLLSASIE